MKRSFFGCFGAMAIAFILPSSAAQIQAGLFDLCSPCTEVGACDADSCNPCDPCGSSDLCNPCDSVCKTTKSGQFFVNGHIEAGVFANAHGSKNTYYTDASREPGTGNLGLAFPGNGDGERLANVRHTGAQVNQIYISTGKAVDGKHGLDIGGTFDFTFGTDAGMIQSAGLEYNTGRVSNDNRHAAGQWGSGDYYSTIAQAYVELAYKKWNVKAGKFFAPFGCDGYKSTDRFFYSLAPTWTFVPATGGGAYATYTMNDNLTLFGGWCSPDRLGESKLDNVGLGGFIWQATKRLNVSYTFAAGELHYIPPVTEIFVNTVLVKYQISNKLRTTFDWSYNQSKTLAGGTESTAGVVHDLIYEYNKKWSFGLRNGVVRYRAAGTTTGDWYSVSLGANWTPSKWLTVKPELRYDSIDNNVVGQPNPFGRGTGDITTVPAQGKGDQLSGGVSAVVKF